jgi:hypothetical protein
LAETFGVCALASGKLFAALALGGVLGSGIEDAFDGKKEFCEVAGRPSGETRNKAFNHEKIFTF